MIFVSADQHFGHDNVRAYCNRDFKNIDDMDEALINAWNKVIKPDDLVYHLGDFTLGGRLDAERYFGRLNGYIRVLGNPWHHDKRWLPPYNGYSNYFSGSGNMVKIEQPIVVLEDVEQIDGRGVPAVLCHYAFEIWERRHYNSLHFHGHSHSRLPIVANRLDVGVDSAYDILGEYRPFELQEAIDISGSI
jgi:calcineurin-like phosphoesterase family protein